MAVAKSKRGRPPLPKSRRRHMIGVHVLGEARDRLERDAKAAGRSLSNHVESLIERSFDRRTLLPEILRATYGEQNAGLLMVVASTLRFGALSVGVTTELQKGNLTGSGWEEHSIEKPQPYKELTDAVCLVLKKLSPAGPLTHPEGMQVNGPKGMQRLSGFIADAVMESIPKDVEIVPLLGSLAPAPVAERKTK